LQNVSEFDIVLIPAPYLVDVLRSENTNAADSKWQSLSCHDQMNSRISVLAGALRTILIRALHRRLISGRAYGTVKTELN
jgi:hypothetical protein